MSKGMIYQAYINKLQKYMHPTAEHLNTKANINESEGRGILQHNNRSRFNILLSIIGRSSKQKMNKETSDFNYILDQMDLTVIHRIFHPE
jgi:hypothetical protein